jgi:glucose/arabinose dehydrogenase
MGRPLQPGAGRAARAVLAILVGLSLGAGPVAAAAAQPASAATPVAAVPGSAGRVNPMAASLAVFASNLSQPVAIAAPADGTDRLFIVEQAGRIRGYSAGGASLGVFLDIRGRVNSAGGEQGLLGLAFHPDYVHNGRFYVSYTNAAGALVVAEYRRSSSNANRASASERRLLRVPHPVNANHNGGNLAFGRDGYLYIGTGDGGSGGDPPNNAQNRRVLLGKILRIAPNVTSAKPAYRVPPTNPYAHSAVYRHEIWAYGLRNPWRFSFDRSTGDLWIGDVGQDRYEEVDHPGAAQANGRGRNFGWRMYEGRSCYHGPCSPSGKVFPVAVYAHGAAGCSVTGGYVYRGSAYPAWRGRYVFGDYCSGRIWWISGSTTARTSMHLISDTSLAISAFGQDAHGELYVVDLNGTVYRLQLA